MATTRRLRGMSTGAPTMANTHPFSQRERVRGERDSERFHRLGLLRRYLSRHRSTDVARPAESLKPEKPAEGWGDAWVDATPRLPLRCVRWRSCADRDWLLKVDRLRAVRWNRYRVELAAPELLPGIQIGIPGGASAKAYWIPVVLRWLP